MLLANFIYTQISLASSQDIKLEIHQNHMHYFKD